MRAPIIWRFFGLEPEKLSPLERTLLRCALLVGLFVLAWTYWDVHDNAGVDFRNRIVGARVMLAGHDPYTFFWQPGMPEEWLDPVYDAKAHRLTLSPPGLLPYAVIAPLPYRFERYLSFGAEWLALLVSLALLARGLPAVRERVVLLLGATLFLIASDVWRIHLERGQVYVFYLLALSLAIACSRRGQVDSVGAGIALGVLGLMRPNLLVMAPALLLARQWRAAGALLATVAVGAAATFLIVPTSSWQSYLNVGDQYYRSIQDPNSVPDRPKPQQERWAEGVDFQMALPHIESSSFAQLYRTLQHECHLPPLPLALTSKLIMAALACLLLGLLAGRPGGDRGATLALIVVLSLDTEFFLPHRWAYADVMLLAPLVLLLPDLLRPGRFQPVLLAVVLLGLLCGSVGQQFFSLYTATVLRSWLVMSALTVLAVTLWLRPHGSVLLWHGLPTMPR